ncbi:AMP-binding protein [Parendozoicomonas sp. Alg238-R29]|uniref:AMP-binding protein n=1 Tax=Parendozoicomonas sp. Alg238-R29 TaxID=2993446 RepID=UPI00248EA0C6|nr:AMP-binding protein [Parendozoicomonas sp. Alg238-R29]
MNNFSSPIDALYQGKKINPHGIAVRDSHGQFTYSELVSQVESLAQGLQTIAPHNLRVGLCAQNHNNHVVAYLAILAAGLVWVPINPKNGLSLNKNLIKKGNVSLIIADQNSLKELPDGLHKILHLGSSGSPQQPNCQELIQQYKGSPFQPAKIYLETVMAIKFTGGSTGEPKGVMQSCGNMLAVMQGLHELYDFQSSDRNLAVAPLTHGGSHYVLPVLAAGGSHILLEQPDISSIQKAFQQQKVSVCFMPPTLIYKLLDAPETTAETFPCLRHLTYGAAPMSGKRIQQALDLFGPKLSTVYGQTEAPLLIAALTPEDMATPALQASVGKAAANCKIAILDKHHQPVPMGETGEIAASGNIVMPGYLDQPEKTSHAFVKTSLINQQPEPPWLLTGDLGYINDDGYLFIKGRVSDLIISGGFNIYPAEVENVLTAIPEIREAVVFSVEDDYWGERLEAAVCLKPGIQLTEQAIRNTLKEGLGAVKTPKHIHILESLPRNPVGKVVRKDIQQLIYPQSKTRQEQQRQKALRQKSTAQGNRMITESTDTRRLIKEMSGLERLEYFESLEQRFGMADNLGYKVLNYREGYWSCTYTPKEHHVNLIGSLHGGIIASLLDTAMGSAVMTTLAVGEGHTMTDLNVKFIRAVMDSEEPLIIEGQIDHAGRRMFTTEGTMKTSDGKLVARAIANAIRL